MHLIKASRVCVWRNRRKAMMSVPEQQCLETASIQTLGDFFNNHHDKLLCTANSDGEPSVALMGTPRLLADGTVDFEIIDVVSVTLDNIRVNKAVAYIAYNPGPRARDYSGVRVY